MCQFSHIVFTSIDSSLSYFSTIIKECKIIFHSFVSCLLSHVIKTVSVVAHSLMRVVHLDSIMGKGTLNPPICIVLCLFNELESHFVKRKALGASGSSEQVEYVNIYGTQTEIGIDKNIYEIEIKT